MTYLRWTTEFYHCSIQWYEHIKSIPQCIMPEFPGILCHWWHHRLYYKVVSHSHIMSHHLEMAHLNTCAKSYSILFKWSSASIFSNRVPNWRFESLDVFRILNDSENLTLSRRGCFEETEVCQKCSQMSIYCRRKQPITRSCISVQ